MNMTGYIGRLFGCPVVVADEPELRALAKQCGENPDDYDKFVFFVNGGNDMTCCRAVFDSLKEKIPESRQ